MGYLKKWKIALGKERPIVEDITLKEIKPIEEVKIEVPRWAEENEEFIKEMERKKSEFTIDVDLEKSNKEKWDIY